jgi:DNA-binding response OmpR family regulator
MSAPLDREKSVSLPYAAVRLLLCDDSPVERMALGHYLRRSGYEVDEAGDGESAISQLQNTEVNAVLLDLQMPGVSGFEVLSYLQKHRKSLPVILLSGMPLDQIQQEIHGLPTRELPPLFLKPVDLDQLMQVLDLQLRGELPDASDARAEQDSLKSRDRTST